MPDLFDLAGVSPTPPPRSPTPPPRRTKPPDLFDLAGAPPPSAPAPAPAPPPLIHLREPTLPTAEELLGEGITPRQAIQRASTGPPAPTLEQSRRAATAPVTAREVAQRPAPPAPEQVPGRLGAARLRAWRKEAAGGPVQQTAAAVARGVVGGALAPFEGALKTKLASAEDVAPDLNPTLRGALTTAGSVAGFAWSPVGGPLFRIAGRAVPRAIAPFLGRMLQQGGVGAVYGTLDTLVNHWHELSQMPPDQAAIKLAQEAGMSAAGFATFGAILEGLTRVAAFSGPKMLTALRSLRDHMRSSPGEITSEVSYAEAPTDPNERLNQDVMRYTKLATRQRDAYLADLRSVAQATGVRYPEETEPYAIKSPDSIREKLTSGRHQGELTDALRQTLVVRDLDDAQRVIAELKRRGYDLVGEPRDRRLDPGGYKDINVKLRKGADDPLIKELQFVTPRMFAIKQTIGHDIYEVDKAVERYEIQYGADDPDVETVRRVLQAESDRLYGQAYQEDSASSRRPTLTSSSRYSSEGTAPALSQPAIKSLKDLRKSLRAPASAARSTSALPGSALASRRTARQSLSDAISGLLTKHSPPSTPSIAPRPAGPKRTGVRGRPTAPVGQAPLRESVIPKTETGTGAPAPSAATPDVLDLTKRGREGPAVLGNGAEVRTPRGTTVSVQHAVVEAQDLLPSHDPITFQPTAGYPQELQPRLRERAASEQQIRSLVHRIGENPGVVTDFTGSAARGIPIVGPDMAVESGNGRVMAIIRAYRQHPEIAQKYKGRLIAQDRMYNIPSEQIRAMREPVLVAIRRTDVDRVRFVQEANQSTKAAMSSVELARADAQRLNQGLMNLFVPSDTGEVATAANRDFIRRFFGEIVSPGDLGRYVDAKGQITQDGITRIRNAIFAKAYGADIGAIEKLAESPDNNVRSITNAMVAAAPRFAALRDKIAQGTAYDLDVGPDVAQAMNKLAALREAGTPVRMFLSQQQMFETDLSPEAERILRFIDETKSSGQRFQEFLQTVADRVESLGNPRQQGLGLETGRIPSKYDLIESAAGAVAKPVAPAPKTVSKPLRGSPAYSLGIVSPGSRALMEMIDRASRAAKAVYEGAQSAIQPGQLPGTLKHPFREQMDRLLGERDVYSVKSQVFWDRTVIPLLQRAVKERLSVADLVGRRSTVEDEMETLSGALSLYIDSMRDPNAVERYLPDAILKWPKLQRYVDRMHDLSDAEKAIAEQALMPYDQMRGKYLVDHEIMTQVLDFHVNHLWESPAPGMLGKHLEPEPLRPGSRLNPRSPYAHQRTIPTFVEGIARGLVPRTLDIVQIGKLADADAARAVMAKGIRDELLRTGAAKWSDVHVQGWVDLGREMSLFRKLIAYPVKTPPPAAAGAQQGLGPSQAPSVPQPGVAARARELRLFVDPDAAQAIRFLYEGDPFKERFVQQEGGLRGFGNWLFRYNTYVKQMELSFSFFHDFNLAKVFAFSRLGTALKLRYGPGAYEKWGPVAMGIDLITSMEPTLERLIRAGLVIGKDNIWDAYYALTGGEKRWGLNNAFVRARNRALWDTLQPTLKATDAVITVRDALKKFGPDTRDIIGRPRLNPRTGKPWTEDEIFKHVATVMNAKYGGLNWDRMGTTIMWRRLWRALLLAPDWTISNILLGQSAIGSRATGFGGFNLASPGTLFATTPEAWAARQSLAKTIIVFGTLLQAVNIRMTGHTTFQNEGGRWWSLQLPWKSDDGRTLFADYLLPGELKDLMRIAGSITNLDADALIGHARAKASPLLGGLISLLSKTDYFGRPLTKPGMTPLEKTEAIGSSFAQKMLPVPIPFASVYEWGMGRIDTTQLLSQAAGAGPVSRGALVPAASWTSLPNDWKAAFLRTLADDERVDLFTQLRTGRITGEMGERLRRYVDRYRYLSDQARGNLPPEQRYLPPHVRRPQHPAPVAP